jgi:hypothetical protein
VTRALTAPISAIAVAIAIVVWGCGAIPNPLATATPPDALHPKPPAAVDPAAVPSPDPTKLDEVARQRAVWAQQGIHTYRLTLLFGCECGLAGGQPVEATVVDDRLTGVSAMGRALDLDEVTGYPMTVDQLFDYADRNAGAGKLELKYDEHLGYPIALGVDPDLNARDDEIRVAVAKLVPAH